MTIKNKVVTVKELLPNMKLFLPYITLVPIYESAWSPLIVAVPTTKYITCSRVVIIHAIFSIYVPVCIGERDQ